MPDIKKFKSISVNKDTHDRLMGMSQDRFEVPVSVQTCINFMLNREDEMRKIFPHVSVEDARH